MQKKYILMPILTTFIFTVALFSCKGQSGGFAPSPSLGSPLALAISPASVTLAVNNLQTFTATGGTEPYIYSVQSGSGTILSTTGGYTAPSTSGSAVVRVTDSAGAFSESIVTVNSALQISPTSQSLNLNATLLLTSVGGVPPITYSVSSGLGSVDSVTGLYTAPASAGSAAVTAIDSYGNISVANLTITNVLSISPTTKTLAVNNTATFVGSGGTPPLTYSKFSGVGSINASTGVYTAPAGAGSAVVRVTDSLGAAASANITINAALSISPATQTMVINGALSFSATGGVSPYTYSVISGSGAVNASTGSYTAPSSAGTDVVRVTDSLGNTSNATITINNSLGISPATKTLAVNNTFTFAGLGGSPSYSYSIVSGGGSINSSTGLFTAPASAGTTVLRVTDSSLNTATATVTVNAALAISPASKTLAVNNQFTFSAAGGVSPYTYSVVSGGGSIVSATGVYTAPASSGAATVRVTDSIGNTSNSTVTINAALAISPSSASLAINTTVAFSGINGTPPYTFSVTSGTGSINSSTGVYTAPSTSGTAVVQVADSFGATATASVSITGGSTDICVVGNPAIGDLCADGTYYAGTVTISGSTYRIATTPGGCGYESGGSATTAPSADFTPTCSGSDSITKQPNFPSSNPASMDIVAAVTNSSTVTGAVSTAALAASPGAPYAAKYCNYLSYSGNTDWYLPNKTELHALVCRGSLSGVTSSTNEDPNCAALGYGTLGHIVPGMQLSTYGTYNTSSGFNWAKSPILEQIGNGPNTGAQGQISNTTNAYVRCIRKIN